MKRILILGASGQDGILLCSQLEKSPDADYLGLSSQGVIDKAGRLIKPGKVTDGGFIREVVREFLPTHTFYLAAHHHSSENAGPIHQGDLWQSSLDIQVLGLIHVLEALCDEGGKARLFYASSSHIFGSPEVSPQNELTPRRPNNVYGITKATGMEACRYYREHRGLFASSGILYNHESVYRKEKFLSQKIIRAALEIKKGRTTPLVLGDLSSEVDWGYAPDYVKAMVRILDLPHPDDFVIATGEPHSVREFAQIAFEQHHLDYRQWVKEDPSIIRPGKARLVGDSKKLRRETGWSPGVSFAEMVRMLTVETARHYEGRHE